MLAKWRGNVQLAFAMHDLVSQSALLLGSALALVLIAARLHMPSSIGYLLAGLLLGPHALGLVEGGGGVHFLAEIGVAILMFFIGLEFSLPRLVASRSIVLGFGGAQIGVTMAIAGAVLIALGLDPIAAAILGGAIAMSSTAIVHKHLIERGEGPTLFGTTATGVLVLQDIVTLVLLALISAAQIAGQDGSALASILRLGAGLIGLVAIGALARPTLGRFLARVARARSSDAFLLAAIAIILASAWLAGALGLSLPLGAFAVGVVLGESDFRHQIEDEIRPFRDFLLGIFFISAGLSIDVSVLADRPVLILAGTLAIILGKLAIVHAIARIAGRENRHGWKIALILAHCGELSLLLAGQVVSLEMIDGAIGQALMGMIALSMMAGAVIVHWHDELAALVSRPSRRDGDLAGIRAAREASDKLDGHVILLGLGPVGRLAATALEGSGKGYVAIERDYEQFCRARRDGHNVVYGDPFRPGMLRAAGIDRASVAIVFVERGRDACPLIGRLHRDHPALCVIASTKDDLDLAPLAESGANYIFPENHAAGLALAHEALIASGMDPEQAHDRIQAVRAQINPELEPFF